jgi:hypothetical protein
MSCSTSFLLLHLVYGFFLGVLYVPQPTEVKQGPDGAHVNEE